MLLPSVRSRPGLDEFSLGLNPFMAGFQLALDEIGPMTRNPERDTERSQVVLAWSPSLISTRHPQLLGIPKGLVSNRSTLCEIAILPPLSCFTDPHLLHLHSEVLPFSRCDMYVVWWCGICQS